MRTFAVTCVVPRGAGAQLHVQVAGRTVTVAGPHGFARTFELPCGAAIEELQTQVYRDVLELRAPYPRASRSGNADGWRAGSRSFLSRDATPAR